MALVPTTKLAKVREAMASGEWELAIKLASKLRSLGKYQAEIDRAKDFLNNPDLYQQMGYDRESVVNSAVASLKKKFSRSWEEIQKKQTRIDGKES